MLYANCALLFIRNFLDNSDSTSRWTPLLFSYTFSTIWACSGLSSVRASPWRANKNATMNFYVHCCKKSIVPGGNRTPNCPLGVRVTLDSTCYLLSIKVSIYRESRHLIGNPCQYKLTDIIPFLMFSVSSLLALLTYGIN